MNPELEKLIEYAITDGVITEKEKEVLYKKAKELGVDIDEFEMILDAKLHQKTSKNNESSKEELKECPTCGGPVDKLLDHCIYCKSSLPKQNSDSISSEELIMNCGEWLGRLEGISIIEFNPQGGPGGKGIVIDAPPGFVSPKKSKIEQFMNSGVTDYSKIFVPFSEIISNIEKYVAILEIRSKNNPNVKIALEGIKIKYNSLKKKSRFILGKKHYVLMILLVVILGFILIFKNAASNHDKKINAENERLELIINKIELAIENRNYDNALFLTSQLVWKVESSWSNTDKEAKHWEDQRIELKKSIEELRNKNNGSQ